MLAFEHVCANVLGVTVWAPAPARQHRATWTTSHSAAQRVCHCWPHAGGLLTLADLQRESIGPETSVITNQSKEKLQRKQSGEACVCHTQYSDVQKMYPKSNITAALHLGWYSVSYDATVMQHHIPDLAAEGDLLSWPLVVTQFIFSTGIRLQLVTCSMGWSSGFPYSLPLYSLTSPLYLIWVMYWIHLPDP